jgi:hypothetical protein
LKTIIRHSLWVAPFTQIQIKSKTNKVKNK